LQDVHIKYASRQAFLLAVKSSKYPASATASRRQRDTSHGL